MARVTAKSWVNSGSNKEISLNSLNRQSARTLSKGLNSRRDFRKRSFLPGCLASFRQQSTITPPTDVCPLDDFCKQNDFLNTSSVDHKEDLVSILWTILIGFIAGVIAKFIMPGDNETIATHAARAPAR